MTAMRHPLLLVISAPSGAGKTTLCNRLVDEFREIVYSVSCTTRKPRGGERDGRDYYFLHEDEFARRQREGAFLESATVHGYRYGTLRDTTLQALKAGRTVLMDIDVQGAGQIRCYVHRRDAEPLLRTAFVDIFVEPPSMSELESRLRGRGEDSPDVIERRLENAREEMTHREKYRHCIVNEDLDCAYAGLRNVVKSEWQKRAFQD
jgi:guanylate kinase